MRAIGDDRANATAIHFVYSDTADLGRCKIGVIRRIFFDSKSSSRSEKVMSTFKFGIAAIVLATALSAAAYAAPPQRAAPQRASPAAAPRGQSDWPVL
jgi:hypothetical protein